MTLTLFSAGSQSRATAFYDEIAKVAPSARWIHQGDDNLLCVIDYRHGIQQTPRYAHASRLQAHLAGDFVLVWNGSELRFAGLHAAARARRQPIVYVENGFGVAGKVQVDGCGVNAASSFAALPRAFFADYPDSGAVPEFEQRQPITEHGEPDPELPDRYAFLPLQIEHDTQIIQHAPARCQTMREVIAFTRGCLPKVTKLVVKEHPSDDTGLGAQLRQQFKAGVLWMRHTQIADILPRAALVVTVNSSVGVQAIAAGVPVIALGNAIYSVCASAFTTWQDATPNLSRRWLSALCDLYLVDAHPAAILARAREIATEGAPWEVHRG